MNLPTNQNCWPCNRRNLDGWRRALPLAVMVSLAAVNGAAQVLKTTVPLPDNVSVDPTKVIVGSVNDVAINTATNKVYVETAYNMVVLDGTTNQTTPLPVGSGGTSLAINTVTNRIYVAGRLDITGATLPSLGMIDGATNTLSDLTIAPTAVANQVLANSTTNAVYVFGADSSTGSYELWILDGATNTVTATLALPVAFSRIVVNPATNKIYAIDRSSLLYIIDVATSTISTVKTHGNDAVGLAMNAVTDKVYVLNKNDQPASVPFGAVDVIDGVDGRLTNTRYVGRNPVSIAVDSVTGTVYVANDDDPATVTILDIGGGRYTAVIGRDYECSPAQISVDTATNRIYVGNSGGGNYISSINGTTHQAAAIDIGQPSSYVAANPGTNSIYTAVNNIGLNDVAVIDGSGGTTPFATVFPKHLYFTSYLNNRSAPQTVYLANTGGAPMTLTDLVFNSIFSSAIAHSDDCHGPIQPGAICPISLTYTPKLPDGPFQSGTFEISVAPPALHTSIKIDAAVAEIATTINPAVQVVDRSCNRFGCQEVLFLQYSVASADPNFAIDSGKVTVTLNGETIASQPYSQPMGFTYLLYLPPVPPAPKNTLVFSYSGAAPFLASSATTVVY